MQKITTFLWFDGQAEEAAKFYTSVFKNSKITSISHYSEAGPAPAGSVMSVNFELEGQEFIALNGGHNTLLRQLSRSS
jgi:predicted 3-demethylubiquinone-9 3-methyltransferase (glyoxalase superfamily)